MNNLIIPIAGKSTRYKELGLKWKLKSKDGEIMLLKSILGLNNDYETIYIVGLKDHLTNDSKKEIINQFKKRNINNIKIIELEKETSSQPETIFKLLEKEDIQGKLVIKDCDNFFKIHINNFNNYVAVSNIEFHKNINKTNKSYVNIEEDYILDIQEKEIISKYFCTGLYAFESAEIFKKYFIYANNQKNNELYISNIIKYMLKDNIKFNYIYGSKYIDWGTKEDWLNFIKKH